VIVFSYREWRPIAGATSAESAKLLILQRTCRNQL
jgi:hypothetical protein